MKSLQEYITEALSEKLTKNDKLIYRRVNKYLLNEWNFKDTICFDNIAYKDVDDWSSIFAKFFDNLDEIPDHDINKKKVEPVFCFTDKDGKLGNLAVYNNNETHYEDGKSGKVTWHKGENIDDTNYRMIDNNVIDKHIKLAGE